MDICMSVELNNDTFAHVVECNSSLDAHWDLEAGRIYSDSGKASTVPMADRRKAEKNMVRANHKSDDDLKSVRHHEPIFGSAGGVGGASGLGRSRKNEASGTKKWRHVSRILKEGWTAFDAVAGPNILDEEC